MIGKLPRLSKEKYLNTMSGKMLDVTKSAELPDNLWSCAEELLNAVPLSEYEVHKRLVEAVYENDERTFRHILLFGEKKNCYVVMVVNMSDNSMLGYYPLDLNEEYGING